MSSFFVFFFSTTKSIIFLHLTTASLNFHLSLFYLYQHFIHTVINKINYFIAHNGTQLLTDHNWDSLTKKSPLLPPPDIFCGTPSEMISYTLNYICAKFGAFTRLVTIFVIFRPNRPD